MAAAQVLFQRFWFVSSFKQFSVRVSAPSPVQTCLMMRYRGLNDVWIRSVGMTGRQHGRALPGYEARRVFDETRTCLFIFRTPPPPSTELPDIRN
jgi:hypothetical protein